MGRSRVNFQTSDDDPSQRSRRKKNASTGDNIESALAGQGIGEGKRAFYHCNYCNKDITGKVRIKCAVCSDFDLCIECFSVGAEVTPHKSNHPYRVMDNLSFPLICPDWNADDEILLLEGIEMYGLGNWAEVAEHVGTKTKEQCIDHYACVYLNSPYFPLPDMSHVVGKNRKELLAMAKGQGFNMLGELTIKEESPLSLPRLKIEDTNKGGHSARLVLNSYADIDCGARSGGANRAAAAAVNNQPKAAEAKDSPNVLKMEDVQVDGNFKGKKPNSSSHGGSLVQLSGYNHKRQEFDPEYDNDAEQMLAEMEFKEADTKEERELKLRVLRIYSKRLDERKRRKDFILERNLLNPNPFEEDLSFEEKKICQRYSVFMRFHSKEEHDELLRSIIAEHRIRKRIQELKEARSAGCRSSAEADRYLEQKRKREAEESARKAKENCQLSMASESVGKDSNLGAAGQMPPSPINDLALMGASGVDLLSDNEKRLCRDMKLPPAHYLKMQEIISVEIFNGNVTKKSDAHSFFQIESSKVDRVYDMLVRKGIAPS